MDRSPQLKSFFEALIKSVPKTVEADQIEKFDLDFASPHGMPNRRPFPSLKNFDRFQALGLSYLGARSALATLPSTRKRLVGVRGIQLSTRLELAQISSWHYRYMPRERLRRLIDLFKAAVEAPIDELSQVAASYKRKTDQQLGPRHRGVHDFDHYDPLIRQLEIHELLALRQLPVGPLRAESETEKRRTETRVKRLVLRKLAIEEDDFLSATDDSFDAAYGCRTIWTFYR